MTIDCIYVCIYVFICGCPQIGILKFIFYFMCMSVLLPCMYVYYAYDWCPRRSKKESDIL